MLLASRCRRWTRRFAGDAARIKAYPATTGTTFFYVTRPGRSVDHERRVAVLSGGRVQCDARRSSSRALALDSWLASSVDATSSMPRLRTAAECHLEFGRPAPLFRACIVNDHGKTRAGDSRRRPGWASMPSACYPAGSYAGEVVYKRTTVDHCLRLADGQRVVATATTRGCTGTEVLLSE
jgi:hypothetical protein